MQVYRVYDGVGNMRFAYEGKWDWSPPFFEEAYAHSHQSAYGADQKLRFYHQYGRQVPDVGEPDHADDLRQEFRYDALGRRVLVRNLHRPYCDTQERDCTHAIERYIWDGDQILWELRAPGDTSDELEAQYTTGREYGLVAYVHGRGIDVCPKGRARIAPFGLLYTDFTELVYASGRKKAHLIPIVDHKSKVAIGWAVGKQAVTEVALEAWEAAKQMLSRLGVSWEDLIVHHDQDPVFTSYGWTSRLLLDDGVQLSYALNGAGDNPEMEAFNSRFKTENQSLFNETRTFDELAAVLAERFKYYSRERRHSAIGYLAPLSYVKSLNDRRRRKRKGSEASQT